MSTPCRVRQICTFGTTVLAVGGGTAYEVAPGTTAGAAGLGVAIVSVIGMGIQLVASEIAQRRQLRVAEIKQRLAELEQQNKAAVVRRERAEKLAVQAIRRADKAESRADRAESRLEVLERLPAVVRQNEARIGGVRGQVEAAVEGLQRAGTFPVPPRAPGQKRPRQTLLVVEDNADDANSWMRRFTARGFDVKHAATTAEALRWLAPEGGHPHFILLDLNVGGEDGGEVLREVRRRNLHVTVAVVTGVADPDRLAEARQLANLVIIKPVSDADESRLFAVIVPEYLSSDSLPAAEGPATGS